MVAKTPMKHRRFVAATSGAALDSDLVRQTLNKVDRCVARLQELQYTVMGGAKVVAGVTLSPRSTRGYLRASVRCKQESLRMWSNPASRRSPAGKFPGGTNGEWRRMSLPAMLLDETVAEILQASRVAKESSAKTTAKLSLYDPAAAAADPKTPVAIRRRTAHKPVAIPSENAALYARRSKEKQPGRFRVIRSESSPATVARARSRIRFKSTSPLVAAARREEKEEEEEGQRRGKLSVAVHRVSPRNRPWTKKTVLFPNALFNSSASSPPPASACRGGQRFYKTKSPIIGRSRPPQTPPPHKFLIKSPTASLGSQLATRRPGVAVVRVLKASPEKLVVLKTRRRSFSPSKFVNRVVSPLRTRFALPKSGTGLKQRPELGTPARIPAIKRT